MKNWIVRAAVFAAVLSVTGMSRASAAQSEGFSDVPRDHWAYEAVTQLKRKGILVGYPPEPAAGKNQSGTQRGPRRTSAGHSGPLPRHPHR